MDVLELCDVFVHVVKVNDPLVHLVDAFTLSHGDLSPAQADNLDNNDKRIWNLILMVSFNA